MAANTSRAAMVLQPARCVGQFGKPSCMLQVWHPVPRRGVAPHQGSRAHAVANAPGKSSLTRFGANQRAQKASATESSDKATVSADELRTMLQAVNAEIAQFRGVQSASGGFTEGGFADDMAVKCVGAAPQDFTRFKAGIGMFEEVPESLREETPLLTPR